MTQFFFIFGQQKPMSVSKVFYYVQGEESCRKLMLDGGNNVDVSPGLWDVVDENNTWQPQ